MSRLGEKFTFEVEEICRTRELFQGEEYKASGLPAAPAVMVDNEIADQGPNLSEERVEAVIRRHLGLPPGEAQKS